MKLTPVCVVRFAGGVLQGDDVGGSDSKVDDDFETGDGGKVEPNQCRSGNSHQGRIQDSIRGSASRIHQRIGIDKRNVIFWIKKKNCLIIMASVYQ